MTARWFLSARDGGARLAEQPRLVPAEASQAISGLPGSAPALWVYTSRRFQTIEGFGGAFTEAAAVTWQALPAEARAQFLVDCFDPVRGHGYTLGRVQMNSCDFALGNYAHVEQPGDFALEGFSIERDRRSLLPFIREALRVAEQCRQRLRAIYMGRLGELTQVPTLTISRSELRWLTLDHRAGFLLSQVDGRTTFDEIIEISGLSELDATRILARLVEHGVIG